MTTTIKLPYTPESVKKIMEIKKAFMEKASSGKDIAGNLIEYANSEIPERLRNKYKPKK